jgi:predicted PurR-regulated permease PerM
VGRSNQLREISYLLAVVVAVVVTATLYLARVVLVPFALAMLFSFLLTPVVTWLERLRLPRTLAALSVVFFLVAGIGSLGYMATDRLVDVTNQLPSYQANIHKKIASLRSPMGLGLKRASDAVEELSREFEAASIGSPVGAQPGALPSPEPPLSVEVVSPHTDFLVSARNALGPLGTAGIAVIFTIFMLIRREDLRNRFIHLAGGGRLNQMTQALDEAGRRISRYVFLQFVVNACYGVVVGVALYFIGVPNALLWGVGAGILRFLPYIGPPIAAILPILLSLAVFDGWTKALITAAVFIGVELVVSNFVEPVLYGAHTGLSALAILFAAVFWTLLWGPIGLVLSTPLTVCLVVFARHVPHLGFLGVLLGDEPVLPPEAQFYQRLLATDQNEAQQVLENYLKEKPLEDLYDSVLIPALSLAEQDRHRNELDETTEQFIFQSVKELLEEINDRSNELRERNAEAPQEMAPGDLSQLSPQQIAANRGCYVVCVPVADEADEIIGTMLAQLLEKAGYRAHFLMAGTISEMLAQVREEKPTIVCLSALPPFAVAHARTLYQRLRAQSPDLKIVIGLWNFAGDSKRVVSRIGGVADVPVSRTLAQAVQQIRLLTNVAPQSATESPVHIV